MEVTDTHSSFREHRLDLRRGIEGIMN